IKEEERKWDPKVMFKPYPIYLLDAEKAPRNNCQY
ncbi:Hypothetical protein EIN_276010, partial [Entamoeba invadens IP1]